jgi:hypothetical protein
VSQRRRSPICTGLALGLAAWVAPAPGPAAQEHTPPAGLGAHAAQVTVTVPAVPGPWPLRFLLGVPEGAALEFGGRPPLAVIDPRSGELLPTQVELGLRRADGTPRSLWVGAAVPSGLAPGSSQSFDVQLTTGAELPVPSAPAAVAAAAAIQGPWQFEVDGLAGSRYHLAPTGPPACVRAGPVESIWRWTAPLRETQPATDAALRLSCIGVVTLELRTWAGVAGCELRVTWEGGLVDAPEAWVLFEEARLVAPPGIELRPLFPTVGLGAQRAEPGRTVLPLAARAAGPHGALPHHRKLWCLIATVPGDPQTVEPILRGGGWGLAQGGPFALDRTAPTALDLPLPLPSAAERAASGARARAELAARTGERAAGGSLDASPGATSWRQPAGLGYGGGTGGGGIEPWPYVDLFAGDPAATWALLQGRLEGRLDRTRSSLVTTSGAPFDPGAADVAFDFALSGEPFYEPGHNRNWPTRGRDLGFREAASQYRAPTAALAAQVLARDFAYGSDDLQHAIRGRRELNALVELYLEPSAVWLLERDAVALRCDLFEGGSGAPDRYATTLRWLAQQRGRGSDFGRDLAWATWQIALAYAAGDDGQRAALAPWCRTAVQVFCETPLSNGALQALSESKERAAAERAAAAAGLSSGSLWPAQAYQQSLLALAGAQLRGSFLPPSERGPLDLALRRLVESVTRLAWGPTAEAPDYRYAVARLVDGQPLPLATRAEVEACYSSSLHPVPGGDGVTTDGTLTPLLLAAGLTVGARDDSFRAALGRFLRAPPEDWLAAARERARSQPAVWWPLVAALEHHGRGR